jgi:putative DNA primase/helicase
LETVFGEAVREGRYVAVFTLPDARSRGFADIRSAAWHALERADTSDVYVGAGLYRTPRRGTAAEVSALVGLWADVDIQDPVHQKTRLPKTEAEAIAFLDELPRPPSVVVHSGHGLQCWWLFQEPLLICGEAQREAATALVRGWTDHLRKLAWRTCGWDLDATGDLARVLRLPGTMNRKGAVPAPVRVIRPATWAAGVRRYRPEDFQPLAREGIAGRAGGVAAGRLRLDPLARPPAEKFAWLLAEDEKFRRTWDRDRPDLVDQSPSAFDLALASLAARAGWDDQEIADLVIANRRAHGDDLKLRPDYYRRTLARARAGGEWRRGVPPPHGLGHGRGSDGAGGPQDASRSGGDRNGI